MSADITLGIKVKDVKKNRVENTVESVMTNPILEGVIWKQILVFFFPILFGSLFQQLYNAADAIIVGQVVGKEALSAVGGTTAAIIQLLVGIFVGLSSGATVIISQYYGAKNVVKVGYAVHTSIAFSILSGFIMMIGGIVFAPAMLHAMDTPVEVMDLSVTYIRVYFVGTIGNLIYNLGAGILRAVGDSKRPLYFLIATCLLNIVLDILFVVVFHMGVFGAGLATILSQALSALLVIIALMRTNDLHKLILKHIKLDWIMLRRIIKIGFPAALQTTMYTSSNVLIQACINMLGTNTIAAWAAYSKIDSLYWMIISAFGIAITTFVGQNYGAGKHDRIKKGIRQCMFMSFIATVLVSVVIYYSGEFCYRLFTTDTAVVDIGMQIIHFIVPLYVTYMSIEILSGALRGVGDCWIPMIMCSLGVCVVRVAWNLIAVPIRPELTTIVFSYPLTWTITSVMFIIYYLFYSRLKRKR